MSQLSPEGVVTVITHFILHASSDASIPSHHTGVYTAQAPRNTHKSQQNFGGAMEQAECLFDILVLSFATRPVIRSSIYGSRHIHMHADTAGTCRVIYYILYTSDSLSSSLGYTN